MIPVSPLRPYSESLQPTDIPWAHIRQHEPETRVWDNLRRERFGVRQQRMVISGIRIPMAPCPNIDGMTSAPISEEPEKVEPRYIPQGPEWDIPFILRHRFFNWVYPILEAEFADRAVEKEMSYGVMDTTSWKKEFLEQRKLLDGEFTLKRGWTKNQVYVMADHIRHAAEHRRNMAVIDIRCGLTLPEVFGNEQVYAHIMSVFELVCVAGRTNARDDPQVYQALDKILGTSRSCGTMTQLYTSIQYIIEGAIFRYTKRNHPEILANKGWTIPEHGEMPLWKEAYLKLTAKQDVFLDPYGYLLNDCLFYAGRLRVSAAHRKFLGLEHTLRQMHQAFKCLMVLGDFEAAVEVEILAEQYLTRNTRDGVLKRLADEYLDEELPPMEDVLRRRRAERRRDAITRVLKNPLMVDEHQQPAPESDWANPMLDDSPSPTTESPSSSSMAWGFDPQELPPTRPLPPLPNRIKVSNPDLTDSLRETASPSMHPKLRTVPEPYSVSHWNPRFDLPDTEDICEMPNLPKMTAEEYKIMTALADAFEAEMLEMDRTEVLGVPSTGYRKGKASCPSVVNPAETGREQTSAGDSESENDGDEVARYYERVGEKVPRYVHISVRREIRVYYMKQTETPAGQEDEQEKPAVSSSEEAEPAVLEDEEEEPVLSEEEEEPGLSDDEQEEFTTSEEEEEAPAFSEDEEAVWGYEQEVAASWGYEQEEPTSWEHEQEKPPSWDEERLLYTPDSNTDIKW